MKQTPLKPDTNIRGFALIATILLMVLLAIITVGTLSLSVVTLRTGTQDSAQAKARANARMALMVAIGELQKQMGPDQRISANSSILDDSAIQHAHWLGVWNSWKAGTDEASQHSTIEGIADEMAPTYETELGRPSYFRKWLVSLNDTEMSSITSPKTLSLSASPMPGPDDDAIFLVADGSLGKGDEKEPDYVAARILDIKDKDTDEITGRYSWWIGDESQKARIMDDSYLTTLPVTSADKIYRTQAPGSMGTTTISGLEKVTDDSQYAALPSLATLDLIVGAEDRPAQQNFFDATPFSFSVLTDVREGGLKRDLSTILEQPIELTDSGDEYMLYAFDDPRFPYLANPNDENLANSRVPIQDLAAYYQLYDDQPTFANGRRGGVSSSLQMNVPEYDGGIKDPKRLNREYTSLYRRPVVTKVQFLLGVTAQPITQAERDQVQGIIDGTLVPLPSPYSLTNPVGITWRNNLINNPLRASDTHRLRLGIQPLVTLWNPTNLPLVMNSSEIMTYTAPPFGIRIRKYPAAGAPFDSAWMNLSYANTSTGSVTAGQGTSALLRLRLGNNPIVFEPGEVKVFSLPSTSAANLTDGGSTLNLTRGATFNVENTWDPYGLFLLRNSAPVGPYGNNVPHVLPFTLDNNAQCLVFGPNDSISISVDSENAGTTNNMRDGRNGSRDSEIRGAGFGLHMVDEGYIIPNPQVDALRHNFMISRHGSGTNLNRTALGGFYQQLMAPGFPGGVTPLPADAQINAIPASQIIASIPTKEIIAIMDFSLSVGCETASGASGGSGGGRRITSRPFLHSASSAMPFIAQSEKDSLYDYGWDWQLNKIIAVEDSILQAKPGTGNGYYGGGYTVELGTTHVIQSEIPVLPPISIASLSHAHLGGFSMAKAIPVGEIPDTDKYNWSQAQVQNPTGVSFQRVTASGQNGLAPHVVQAIGNSYAHPNIPAERAFTTKTRLFDLDEGAKVVPFADHSYLANKALWDEYFFSSIAPQPSKVPLFGGSDRTAKQVADQFFRLGSPETSIPLPNRRIIPYKTNLDQTTLDSLFTESNLFSNGLADKIAANLMIEGGFNINSTSVNAWKTFFSSLKGKPVAYLNGGTTPSEATVEGSAISPGSLPNAAPVKTADISSPNTPENQWKTGRELTDDEIEQLAIAMVKQVKLRGPFLSTSEFINRRLEGDSSSVASERSVKGALQAALDDPSVSINANFRTPGRLLDSEASAINTFEFPDAAKGPVAYGSNAYVDQADVLRHFTEQITPRGDTFVIRTYGDALDSNGKVIARAWCEAVVQRIPEYVNSDDAPYLKQADPLLSDASKTFGRKIQIYSFRWLNPNEV